MYMIKPHRSIDGIIILIMFNLQPSEITQSTYVVFINVYFNHSVDCISTLFSILAFIFIQCLTFEIKLNKIITKILRMDKSITPSCSKYQF